MVGASKRVWIVVAALVGAVAVALAVVLSAAGGEEPAGGRDGARAAESDRRAAAPARPAGVRGHLRALQRIADRHGGNRAAGTAGDRASVDYVAAGLRAAGFEVTRQRVRFPFFDEQARPRVTVAGAATLRGLRTMTYSPGGEARGALRQISPRPAGQTGDRAAGCAASEFSALRRGEVALIERGTCRLRQKVDNAARAGASAVVIFNDGRPGRTAPIAGSLVRPGARIPAVFASFETGRALARAAGREVSVVVRAVSEQRTTTNVVGERAPRRASGRVVMAGAHLDSVAEGPGINDNGTGVAAVLNAAETVKPRAGGPRLRVAFWGAEELGLIGSRRYVRSLDRAERRSIAAYLNLDMVGSPNAGRFVYSGGSGGAALAATAERALRARGVEVEDTGLGSGSDHASFQRAGVPIVGLFSGAGSGKTEAQARRWGGRAGRPFDRCYHRACDRLGGIDRTALRELGGGTASVVEALMRRAGR